MPDATLNVGVATVPEIVYAADTMGLPVHPNPYGTARARIVILLFSGIVIGAVYEYVFPPPGTGIVPSVVKAI